jgi:hypothetical protein
MYICTWLEHCPPLFREVLRIEAETPAELLAGVALALRKGKIQPGHEMAIIQCPPGEGSDLRAAIQELMVQRM